MTTLSNSIFSWIYSIPSLSNDLEMINTLTVGTAIFTIILTLKNFLSPAAYGRHDINSLSKFSWIPKLKARTAWTICFIPVFVIAILIILTTPCKQLGNPYNLMAFISFVVHYANRFLYSLKISEKAHPLGGIFLPQLMIGVSINCFFQCHHLANVNETTPSSLAYIGLLLVIVGLSINIHHDNILLNLRDPNSSTKDKHEKSSYKIPVGGLFEYISCANYFGEIVEWFGYALITRGAPQILLFLFSTSFLGIRALQHHAFYLKTFSSKYPPNRKAVIPFIL